MSYQSVDMFSYQTHSRLWFVLLTCFALVNLWNCTSDESRDLSSTRFSTQSHRAGRDCMDCHKIGGDGVGHFVVAGTVYSTRDTSKVLPNGYIKFFATDDRTGTPQFVVEVDGYGNFFTTDNFEFTKFYATHANVSGGMSSMIAKPSSGACNSCHGISTGRIVAE